MGLFSKIFEKKVCAICGGEIGLMGNRKLEDGSLCKECASKLSPWFSERRSSTVAQISEQLAYREENKAAVSAFHATRTLGIYTKVLLDEDHRKFMVTSASNLKDANPDVLDYAQVTACQLDIDERKTEQKQKNDEGKEVSYDPPRYVYRYDFYVVIHVNFPYFDTIRFKVNRSSIEVTPPALRVAAIRDVAAFARGSSVDFREAEQIGQDIVEALTGARQQVREEAVAASTPKAAVTCPFCGASTIPDAHGRCEYCGGSVVG